MYFKNTLMKDLQILQNIGLSENAAKIYIALLQKGDMNISDISGYTGIHRPVIYSTLPYMKEIWVICERIRGKRKFFCAESPENLQNIFEKTQRDFQGTLSRFTHLYEEQKRSSMTLKVIEGENFAKHIFDDIGYCLPQDWVYYRYSSVKEVRDQNKFEYYKKMRDQKNIQRMIITSDFLKEWKRKSLSHEVVTIPKSYDIFDDNISKVIYGDKIGILNHTLKISFILQDQKLANFEKKIFQLLFQKLRK